MESSVKRILKAAFVAVFYLVLWQGIALFVGKSLLLPGPIETLERLFSLLKTSEAWIAAGLTILRVISGYLLGVVSGVLLAVLTSRIVLLDELLRPLRGIIKATPVTSFILLALLWLSSFSAPPDTSRAS